MTLPVTACEQAPVSGPWSVLALPADSPCPWCGRPSAEHERVLPDEDKP